MDGPCGACFLEPDPLPEGKAIVGTSTPRGAETGLAKTFRSLRHRNYRLYFFGQLVSLIGTWMQTAAVTWLAYDLTGVNRWPALVSAAGILPTFLFGAWGGLLADRWPKRWLIFVTQTAFALLALWLAVAVLAGLITPWQLLVVSALGGLVQAIDLPARLAFVMDMTGREDLMNAVALNSLLFNVARALGPALGGGLLSLVGPGPCFLANALSFLAVLWALSLMDICGAAQGGPRDGGLRALLGGFAYLAKRRDLAFLVLLACTTSLFGWPVGALLPALAKNELNAQANGYGLLVSGMGVGALLAAWTLATFGSVEHRRFLLSSGIMLIAAALVALSLVRSLPLAIGCCAVVGFGLILFLATCQSIVQLGSGNENRGRIMGIYAMTLSGAVPLGQALAGPAADWWGEPVVVAALGVACVASASLLVLLFSLGSREPLVAPDKLLVEPASADTSPEM
jgi:MFS family permease